MGKSIEATTAQSVLYSTGNLANNLYFMFVSTYIMFFYTNVLGISPIVAGQIFMVARLVDAVTDPLMGMLVDKTNTKMGKYRPYITFGAPLLAVAFVAMFNVPQFDVAGRVVYAYTMYILYSLAWTVVQTPQLALPIIMSNNLAKRAKIQAIFQAIGSLGLVAVTAVFLPLLNTFGGQEHPQAWRIVTLMIAGIATVVFILSALSVRKLDTFTPKPPQAEIALKQKKPLQLRAVFGNVVLLIILIGYGTDMLANQLGTSMNLYFFTYNLNGRTELMGLLGLVTLPVSLVLVFVIGPMLRRFGKKTSIIACEGISIGGTLLVLLGAPAQNIPLVVGGSIISGTAFGITNMLCRAAVLDGATYAKWKMGLDASALVSSTFTFVNKVAQALAGVVAGYVLEWVAFNPAAAQQSAQTLQGILYMKTLVPIAAFVITIVAMLFYPLNKARENEMQQAMDQMAEEDRLAMATAADSV